jgi:hypothetical protein
LLLLLSLLLLLLLLLISSSVGYHDFKLADLHFSPMNKTETNNGGMDSMVVSINKIVSQFHL